MIFILSACDTTDQEHFDVQPELRTYVNQFFIEAGTRNAIVHKQDLMISIKSLPKESPAWGMTYYENPIKIVIDKDFYYKNYGSEEGRLKIEYIVFHELGHALLGRAHVETYSIMNYKTAYIEYYASSTSCRKALIDELFQNRK